eukprot:TRINITY_DN245_c0_g1_i1.p1 TRINITY_DN245_c0_g1~~TRINITY_DN245_c0_g1_i1.p1  ORF type:complete len:176 (+),score=24.93 TRINITY_DN245_c0_g1_i1:61-588(+)
MMHFINVATLLFLLSTYVLETTQQPSDNIILFIEGFAQGLEVEIGNPAECAGDLNVTEQDLLIGFRQIKAGIQDFSVSELETGLKYWASALIEITAALRDCGAGTIADDIDNILQEINSGTTGILEFIIKELLSILENDVKDLFIRAIDSAEGGNWQQAGYYTGKIMGILLNQFN